MFVNSLHGIHPFSEPWNWRKPLKDSFNWVAFAVYSKYQSKIKSLSLFKKTLFHSKGSRSMGFPVIYIPSWYLDWLIQSIFVTALIAFSLMKINCMSASSTQATSSSVLTLRVGVCCLLHTLPVRSLATSSAKQSSVSSCAVCPNLFDSCDVQPESF